MENDIIDPNPPVSHDREPGPVEREPVSPDRFPSDPEAPAGPSSGWPATDSSPVLVSEAPASWLDKPLAALIPTVRLEHVLIALILILAVFSRLYILGARVMSHDEVNHVVPSFELSQGRGYAHDPVTHGPFQFHIVALTYILFGDNDFTSRLPAALFSMATVGFAWWGFRRYLGKSGALIAALLFLISPFALFYGRYTRNEAFVGLYALVMLWSILRYLETRRPRYMYLFTLSVAMHFITKETAFIYAAQALIFLAVLFFARVVRQPWPRPDRFMPFLIALAVALVLVGAGLGTIALQPEPGAPTETPAGAAEVAPEVLPEAAQPVERAPVTAMVLIGLGVAAVAAGLVFLVTGFTWEKLKTEPSFDLLIMLGTLVLPHLAPFPVKLLGFNPLDYQFPGVYPTAIAVIVLVLIAVTIGLLWKPVLWLGNAALFYTLFIVFYTTLFTNGNGFLTGLVGSLGYWVSQQDVNRGSQPWYYFTLVQIPMYEYLAALGTVLAAAIGFRRKLFTQPVPLDLADPSSLADSTPPDGELAGTGLRPDGAPEGAAARLPVLALFLYWAVSSLLAFSVAGEKMPWLTFHIAIPMILCAAWAFGYWVDRIPWAAFRRHRAWLVLLLLPVFLLAVSGGIGRLLGATPPFEGNTLDQLQATTTFLLSVVVAVGSGAGLYVLLKDWETASLVRLFGLAAFALLAVQTARTAIRSSYINYDEAKEFLVYAHAARGPKEILEQVEEISMRTTGGLDIAVAYDNDGLYPYWWYFRHYPNKVFFGENPTRELRNNPIVLAGEDNYERLENILGENYNQFEYVRLWWPMQDYWDLNWERIKYALATPAVRAGLMQIWLNANYAPYAEAVDNQNLTPTNWYPDNNIRMYMRKDIVAQIWNYGAAPAPEVIVPDPYEGGEISLEADRIIGVPGSAPGEFQAPHGIAAAPDGSLYVADSRNHRIQHLAADGTVLQTWGSFSGENVANAPGGTFNEPWGIAVGPDGSVYVSDTWNHRVQKFTADGQFLAMWGYFGQAEAPEAFWGPRGLAVDAQGRLYVTDTGNKRIVVFTPDGEYVAQFGSEGFDLGQFSEPVAVAIAPSGNVYVTDTWNQRIQLLSPDASGTSFFPVTSWDIDGWFGESLENKPFIAVDAAGQVYVTDPEGYRVLVFDGQGQFLRTWGDFSSGPDGFGLASGIAVDPQGGVWVSDAGNNRLMHFVPPVE
jgi:predicted membrane-bound mannosyltransferase/DNA-binding beta-propeller fold protein YncE